MIAYKVVSLVDNEYRSVMHNALKRHGLERFSVKYQIGKTTYAPKTKVFNRLYCFETLIDAKAFHRNNSYHGYNILECEVAPLKSIQLFEWDDLQYIIKTGKLSGQRKKYGIHGTIPCKWVKPIRIVS